MRNNGSKYIVLFALLISVAALSLGFAAFTSTLTISAEATYQDPGNWDLKLSTVNNKIQSGTVTPTATGATGSAATLTANSISGLKATFTGTGQSVKYSFYAYNASAFLGYLNSVSIGTKTCTAKTGTNQTYVNTACNDISLSVKVGSQTYTTTNTSISSHTLAASTGEAVEVTISYAENGATADGDFDVSFGNVTLLYGTAD